jgi:hypothetical protein
MNGNFFQQLRSGMVLLAVVIAACFGYALFNLQEAPSVQTLAQGSDARRSAEVPRHGFQLLPNFDWPAPEPQGPDGTWNYELFTPPTIELQDGELFASGLKKTGEGEVLLRLSRVEELPYRLHLEGFVKSGDGDLKVFIRDARSKKLYALAGGNHSDDGNFSVVACGLGGDGTGEEGAAIPEVQVQDGEDGQTRRLLLDRTLASGNFIVEIIAEFCGREETHLLSRIGETFSVGSEAFELVHANPANRAVIVRRNAPGSPLRTLSY